MRSMTGFGRAAFSDENQVQWVIEVLSVNRKGFDVRMDTPKELLFLDIPCRKAVGNRVSRGQVTVRITSNKNHGELPPQKTFVAAKQKLESLAKELGFDAESFSFPFLFSTALSWGHPASETSGDRFLAALDEALDGLIEMKQAEGKALSADFEKRLVTLSGITDEMEKGASDRPKAIREKIVGNLSELMEEAASDERVLKEIALYVEKCDYTEEITRLRSHLNQGKERIKSRETSIGRALEFLIQEVLRELNTIGSKASDLSITKLILTAKAEVEKMREQVQNIE